MITQQLIELYARLEANKATPADVSKIREFITLAQDVRRAQREYFKDRNVANLTRSKELEQKLDRFWTTPPPVQRNLL